MTLFETKSYDLVILDVMLPYLNGFELTQRIRLKSFQTPIIILSAKVGTGDRVKGLKLGADDFMAKPFHIQKLLEKVERMLKDKGWYEKTGS